MGTAGGPSHPQETESSGNSRVLALARSGTGRDQTARAGLPRIDGRASFVGKRFPRHQRKRKKHSVPLGSDGNRHGPSFFNSARARRRIARGGTSRVHQRFKNGRHFHLLTEKRI